MVQKAKTRKPKPGAWFRPVRGSYLPASAAGWLTYVPFVGYLVFALVAGTHYTSSAALAVLFVAPNWIAASVVMTYVATRKS